jgi:hypothetical protein
MAKVLSLGESIQVLLKGAYDEEKRDRIVRSLCRNKNSNEKTKASLNSIAYFESRKVMLSKDKLPELQEAYNRLMLAPQNRECTNMVLRVLDEAIVDGGSLAKGPEYSEKQTTRVTFQVYVVKILLGKSLLTTYSHH